MSDKKFFIAVAGNIGTGKTTLTQMLSERLGWTPHFEAVTHNPYLADFYKNMSRWSFPLQIYFLTHRFEAHQKVGIEARSVIQDRSIYEDANIFARNLFEQGQLQERDYQNYLELYRIMNQYLSPPSLVVYLKKSLPQLKRQIALRGREYEKDLPADYLANLNRYYDEWMESYSFGRKLIISSDHLDFVNNSADFDYIVHQVLNELDLSVSFQPSLRTELEVDRTLSAIKY